MQGDTNPTRISEGFAIVSCHELLDLVLPSMAENVVSISEAARVLDSGLSFEIFVASLPFSRRGLDRGSWQSAVSLAHLAKAPSTSRHFPF